MLFFAPSTSKFMQKKHELLRGIQYTVYCEGTNIKKKTCKKKQKKAAKIKQVGCNLK